MTTKALQTLYLPPDKAILPMPDGFRAQWNHGNLIYCHIETGRLYDFDFIPPTKGDTLDLGECPSCEGRCKIGKIVHNPQFDEDVFIGGTCRECTEGRLKRTVKAVSLVKSFKIDFNRQDSIRVFKRDLLPNEYVILVELETSKGEENE